ncbi:hypothetical protein BGZ83_004695, partial [Gryganskiella cystojenkinii]
HKSATASPAMSAGFQRNQHSNPSHDHHDGAENDLHSGRDGVNKKQKLDSASNNGHSGTTFVTQAEDVYSPSTSDHEKHLYQQQQSEDLNMDEVETAENENGFEEWHEVVRTRDRYFAVFVKDEHIYGKTQAEKRQELQAMIWRRKINIIDGPYPRKTADGFGFKVAVETENELERLLAVTLDLPTNDEEGSPMKLAMFTRLDNSKRVLEIERTVEVYGLHPRTPTDRVKSALAR